VLESIQMLNTDAEISDILTNSAYPLNFDPYNLEWDIPEWGTLIRRRRLEAVSNSLTDLLWSNPQLARGLLVKEPRDPVFNLKGFILDLLLLEKAKEGTGLCEYFFSFAFFSPKAIRQRREGCKTIGPLNCIR